jgi:cell division protein ZapA (FtsZ GTPase activity inhibitor)
MAESEKQPVSFTILNHSYSVIPSGDPQTLLDAATAVEEIMQRLLRSRNLDTNRAAVFAALHFAQKFVEQQNIVDGVTGAVDKGGRKVNSLLDLIVD